MKDRERERRWGSVWAERGWLGVTRKKGEESHAQAHTHAHTQTHNVNSVA